MGAHEELAHKLLNETIGISIETISNDFEEIPGGKASSPTTYQKIIFQIKEEEPDFYAVGVLFTLSLMSFTYAAPRGYSGNFFVPDEQWNLAYFVQGLAYVRQNLLFSADYISGRLMKTDIVFETGGRVELSTRNRGRGAERWLTQMQGKKHIRPVR